MGATDGDIHTMLVNVGTGSQFSVYTKDYMTCPGLETRPFPGGYLLVGASLCGGRAYFPGFTLTAAVSGLIYGLFLGKKTSIPRIVLSVVLSQLLCTVLMNSYWISSLYGAPFGATALSRLAQAAVMGTVQIVFMVLCLERICTRIKLR